MAVNASNAQLHYSGNAQAGLALLAAETMLISQLIQSQTNWRHSAPLLGASIALQLAIAVATGPAMGTPLRANLGSVQSWGYQLQQSDPREVAASDYDLMVVDYARDGSADLTFTPAEMAMMRQKPDGSPRIVLAYLSIGEAEDYRPYWQHAWTEAPPSWLGAENPDWAGNYAVRYWAPEWQAHIFGAPDAYLDVIIAAGFDGVYLDRIDAFDVPDTTAARPRRMQLMADFVQAIAVYARAQHPNFIIVGQNAEELLANKKYADAIDAVGKEDLFYGLAGDGTLNSKSELRASLTLLQDFRASGKPIFIIEYLDTPESKARARTSAAALGAPLFIGDRELNDVRSR